MIDKIEKKEALWFGWEKVKAEPSYFVGLMLLAAVTFVVPSYISGRLIVVSESLSVIIFLASWFLQIGVGLGLIGLALKFSQGLRPPLSELFNYFRFFWPYFLASLLYSLVIFAGVILLVVPAFVWGIKYSLFPFFIIDKGVRPLEALHLSAEATRVVKWQLFLFLLLLALINLAGVLLAGVGLLLTVPVTYIAWAHVYSRLTGKPSVPIPGGSVQSSR